MHPVPCSPGGSTVSHRAHPAPATGWACDSGWAQLSSISSWTQWLFQEVDKWKRLANQRPSFWRLKGWVQGPVLVGGVSWALPWKAEDCGQKPREKPDHPTEGRRAMERDAARVRTKAAGSGGWVLLRAVWGGSEENPGDPLMRAWEEGMAEEESEEFAMERVMWKPPARFSLWSIQENPRCSLMQENARLAWGQRQRLHRTADVDAVTSNSHKIKGIPWPIQWLGLHAFPAEGPGSIPGWGTKLPQVVWPKKKKKKRAEAPLLNILNLIPLKTYSKGTFSLLWFNMVLEVLSLVLRRVTQLAGLESLIKPHAPLGKVRLFPPCL